MRRDGALRRGVGDAMSDILTFLDDYVAVVGALYVVLLYFIHESLLSEVSRVRVVAVLRGPSASQRYRTALRNVLDWIDRQLSPYAGALRPAAVSRAWTPVLFEFAFSMALLYPTILLLAFWAATNFDGKLGSEMVIVASVDKDAIRYGALAALLVTVLVTIRARLYRRADKYLAEALVLFLAITVATAGMFFILAANQEGGGIALDSSALIVGLVGATTFVAAGAFRGMAAMSITVLCAAATALFIQLGGASAESVFAAAADIVLSATVAPGLPVPATLLLGVAVAVVASGALGWGGRRLTIWCRGTLARSAAFGLGGGLGLLAGMLLMPVLDVPVAFDLEVALTCGVGLAGIVFTGILAAAAVRLFGDLVRNAFVAHVVFVGGGAALLSVIVQAGGVDDNLRLYLLLFALLPLWNAAFDYLSIGLTRWALRKSIDTERSVPILWSGFDVLAALIFLTGLGFALIATAHLVRTGDGLPLLDVVQLLADMQANSDQYFWLYVALLSTLAPTLLHFAIACFSFITMLPGALNHWVAGLAERAGTDGSARAIAVLILTISASLAIAAPLLAIYLVLTAIGAAAPLLGESYLALFDAFAAVLTTQWPLD